MKSAFQFEDDSNYFEFQPIGEFEEGNPDPTLEAHRVAYGQSDATPNGYKVFNWTRKISRFWRIQLRGISRSCWQKVQEFLAKTRFLYIPDVENIHYEFRVYVRGDDKGVAVVADNVGDGVIFTEFEIEEW